MRAPARRRRCPTSVDAVGAEACPMAERARHTPAAGHQTGSPAISAASWPCATSRSRCTRASCTPSSARTAPARPRSSTCCRARSSRPRAASSSMARDVAGEPAWRMTRPRRRPLVPAHQHLRVADRAGERAAGGAGGRCVRRIRLFAGRRT